jgi:hypothetical protein
MTSIYGILDTETNQFFTAASGNVAWPSILSAEASYIFYMKLRFPKADFQEFNEQTRYVIVDLTEAYFRLEGLEK